ncbi:choice-of-anchor U domain-containing protein, partial [Motiliproteus sp. MSK22-1]|uniref:choice-of-anchor U domain-containing protein n=1 Tax=Motiliproteus sp. MSK22-1 TaxID=1897630 RepID=UPI0011809AC7
VSAIENSTVVTTLAATDEDLNPTLSYGLLNSGDSALFSLNSQTGQLSFINAPDFETPDDSDGDNHYALQVSVTDETGLSTTQALTVKLTNEVETGDDTDNDGIPDTDEGGGTVDTDNDGLPDNEDPDSDNDGQNDAEEVNQDTDNDGINDNLDPDDDNDSIDSAVEALVPTLTTGGMAGDGNGDGVVDTRQNSVSSTALVRADKTDDNGNPVSSFVTLVTDSQAGKAANGNSTSRLNSFTQQAAPDDVPTEIEMPFGLISFVSQAEELGATETFSLYLDADIPVNGYWKQNSEGEWVNIATAIVAEGNKTRIDFEITDGGEFDEDGEANGIIIDPGAPGMITTTTCEWDLFRDDADADAMPDTIETLLGYDAAVKDNDVFSIDELWIRQISRDLIGEEISDQDLSDWSAGLDAGISKQEMLESFTQTERYDATSTLVRLYHAVLDRSPEKCGFDYWQQQLNNGLSTLELSANMLASAEFLTDHSNLENSGYLDLLY